MTHAQHIRNLLSVYDRGNQQERAEAHASYQRYHDLIEEIASRTGHPVRVAVGVFSALSPNNSYVSNLANCRTLLMAERSGGEIDSFRVNTYNSNKEKAWKMARGGIDPLELFKGLKTRAFFLNCLNPMDPEPITVDGHMFWIWMGRKGAVKTRGAEGKRNDRARRVEREGKAPRGAVEPQDALFHLPAHQPRAKPIIGQSRKENAPPSLSPKLYHEIADAIRLVAELRGVIGCQAQAVLWQNWRRLHNVQGAAQSEFLARDVFAAGNHNHKHASSGCGQ